jgi:hypothetical protein
MADTITIPPALANDPRFSILAQIAIEAFQLDLTPLMVYLVDIVDVSVLPFLAEQFSLVGDGWELAATEAAQRALIKASIQIHQKKGTPWAIRQLFLLLGLGGVDIDEGRSGYVRDGSKRRDGFPVRGDRSLRWAEYRIRCYRLLTVEQATVARQMLANIAPARCFLFDIDFTAAALIRNGVARRDGSYTRGLV